MSDRQELILESAIRVIAQSGVRALRVEKLAEQMLLLEIQGTPTVRENSIAWGELRASAVFNDELREQLRDATQAWSADLEKVINMAQDAEMADPTIEPIDAAERLTALVEGLSERWLSGSITLERAQHLLAGAITAELGA